MLKPEFFPIVARTKIKVANRELSYLFAAGADIPAQAQKFIKDFDKQRPVKPFEFDVDLPREVLRSS